MVEKDKELGDQQVEEAVLVTLKKHTFFPNLRGQHVRNQDCPAVNFWIETGRG